MFKAFGLSKPKTDAIPPNRKILTIEFLEGNTFHLQQSLHLKNNNLYPIKQAKIH